MAKKKQMLLIINPRSGREKIRLKLLDILDAYTGAGYQIQVHVTQKSLDARAFAILSIFGCASRDSEGRFRFS